MIIPMRCFSCGKPISHLWDEFKKRKESGDNIKKILDDFNLKRYCCRAVFLGHIDVIDTVAKFKRG